MMLFLFICICVALTAVMVVMLKKHNDQQRKQLANYEQNLPSLTVDLTTLPIDVDDEEIAEQAPPSSAQHTDQLYPNTAGTNDLTATPEVVSLKSENNLSNTANWKELVRSYREQGLYDKAILAADSAWPQWQYYEQVALTIRAAIRESKKNSPKEFENRLAQLYRTAVEASLLHEKPNQEPTSDMILLMSDRDRLREIDWPYSRIGTDKLRLLNKTDRKQLLDFFGQATHHGTAHTFLLEQH